ncbi:hypothetical protein A3306_04820 [Rickettsia bellii]|uniref:Uncharacterized protein n=1 Tax=Rickettsia bellii str. RML An4 TaxID=1359193 RepID=A0A0F3QCK7_RICBE|nr:hypothetical protein [Rickettsia bellii]ARD86500.1 hypothetical protein A3306_04820 [Rickettsia bellii]KJV89891.1 hypothetical protein RBEAN4_0880 [Rickettsia bellii str. RML An4]
MLGFITAFFTIESSNTKNDKSIKGKIKNDEAIVDTFLNMSLESIEKTSPKPFSSSTHVEKKVNVDENDNGIFSTFYNTAVKYVLDLVAPVVQSVVQYARDYIEGDYNKYTLKIIVCKDIINKIMTLKTILVKTIMLN